MAYNNGVWTDPIWMQAPTVGQQQSLEQFHAASGLASPNGLNSYGQPLKAGMQTLTNNRDMRDNLQTQGADFSGWQNQLMDLLKNPSSIQNDPSYQFRLGQGEQAINRSAAAKGMLGSGNVLAELAKYGQGMASEELGNKTNTLAGLMGGAQKFGVATDYFKQPTYGQPVQPTNTQWNMAYGNQNPTSNW